MGFILSISAALISPLIMTVFDVVLWVVDLSFD